ncbi:MAG: hypothetical protein ACYCQJ_01450 [Nitrososphaerales archaeon]
MHTILVKGVSDDTLKRLKKLKIERDCDTWAELLDELAKSNHRVSFTKRDISEMREGVKEFVALADKVSKKWQGSATVLEEFRVSRKHDRHQAHSDN